MIFICEGPCWQFLLELHASHSSRIEYRIGTTVSWLVNPSIDAPEYLFCRCNRSRMHRNPHQRYHCRWDTCSSYLHLQKWSNTEEWSDTDQNAIGICFPSRDPAESRPHHTLSLLSPCHRRIHLERSRTRRQLRNWDHRFWMILCWLACEFSTI